MTTKRKQVKHMKLTVFLTYCKQQARQYAKKSVKYVKKHPQQAKLAGGALVAAAVTIAAVWMVFGTGWVFKQIPTESITQQQLATKSTPPQETVPVQPITATSPAELKQLQEKMDRRIDELTRALENKAAAELGKAEAAKEFAEGMAKHDEAVRDRTVIGQRDNYLRNSSFYTGLPVSVASPPVKAPDKEFVLPLMSDLKLQLPGEAPPAQ